MFGLGREAQVRREAAQEIHAVMQVEVLKAAVAREQLDLPLQAAQSPADCAFLIGQLMAKAPKSSMGRFAGRRLPRLTGIGLALETLYYGIDQSRNDALVQGLIVNSLLSLISSAAERKEQLNDADFEMLHTIAELYDQHPKVMASTSR